MQWAFGSLSPRLNLFRDDPIVWRTFGLAVGVFVFSVTSALAIGNKPEVSVIVPDCGGSSLCSLAVALMRGPAGEGLHVTSSWVSTLAAIAAEGHGILDDRYRRAVGAWTRPPRRYCRRCTASSCGRTGRPPCSNLTCPACSSTAGSAVIVPRSASVPTLQPGAPVADLHGGEVADLRGGEVADEAVFDGLLTGQERTFRQDPLFAFRLLADIGLRALSPAVNDPATAVQVLDTIQGILSPPRRPGPRRRRHRRRLRGGPGGPGPSVLG